MENGNDGYGWENRHRRAVKLNSKYGIIAGAAAAGGAVGIDFLEQFQP